MVARIAEDRGPKGEKELKLKLGLGLGWKVGCIREYFDFYTIVHHFTISWSK
jgi:hypothetical protein